MKYNSKLRTAIKEIVCASYEHPTAEDVYLMMQNKNINTSISTVYRNLHQLSEEGIIKEIVMPSGKVHYDGRTYDHGHAYCISCNRIYDLSISDKEIDDLATPITCSSAQVSSSSTYGTILSGPAPHTGHLSGLSIICPQTKHLYFILYLLMNSYVYFC